MRIIFAFSKTCVDDNVAAVHCGPSGHCGDVRNLCQVVTFNKAQTGNVLYFYLINYVSESTQSTCPEHQVDFRCKTINDHFNISSIRRKSLFLVSGNHRAFSIYVLFWKLKQKPLDQKQTNRLTAFKVKGIILLSLDLTGRTANKWLYTTCDFLQFVTIFVILWHSVIIYSVTCSFTLAYFVAHFIGSSTVSPLLATAGSRSNTTGLRQPRSTICQKRGSPQTKNGGGSKSY